MGPQPRTRSIAVAWAEPCVTGTRSTRVRWDGAPEADEHDEDQGRQCHGRRDQLDRQDIQPRGDTGQGTVTCSGRGLVGELDHLMALGLQPGCHLAPEGHSATLVRGGVGDQPDTFAHGRTLQLAGFVVGDLGPLRLTARAPPVQEGRNANGGIEETDHRKG